MAKEFQGVIVDYEAGLNALYPITGTVVRPRPIQTVAKALTTDSRCMIPRQGKRAKIRVT